MYRVSSLRYKHREQIRLYELQRRLKTIDVIANDAVGLGITFKLLYLNPEVTNKLLRSP